MRLINLFTLFVCASLSIVTDLDAAPGVLRVPTEQEHVGALEINAMEKIRASSSSGTKWLPNPPYWGRLMNHLVKSRNMVRGNEAANARKLKNLKARLKNVTPGDDKELDKLKEKLNVVLGPRKTLEELLRKKEIFLEDILKQVDQDRLDPFDRAHLIVKSNQFRAIYEHFLPRNEILTEKALTDKALTEKALTDKALFKIVGGFDYPKEVAEFLFLAGEHDKNERVKIYATALQDFQFMCWKVKMKSPKSVAGKVFGVPDVSPQQLEENPLLKDILDSYSKYLAKGMAPELPK